MMDQAGMTLRPPETDTFRVRNPRSKMSTSDISRIIDESCRRLLQSSSPSVRYWLLTDIQGKGREDSIVQRTLTDCERYPARMKLLRTMKEDGTWPAQNGVRHRDGTEPRGSTDQIQATVYRNLLGLLHFVTGPDDGGVRRALERLLEGQTEEGHLRGPMTHGLPQPHYDGHALYILFGFFMEHDIRVKRVADRLMSIQRMDGGWNMPYLQDVRYLEEYRHLKMDEFIRLMGTDERDRYDPSTVFDVPSCHWTTMMVLWGLGDLPAYRREQMRSEGGGLPVEQVLPEEPSLELLRGSKELDDPQVPEQQVQRSGRAGDTHEDGQRAGRSEDGQAHQMAHSTEVPGRVMDRI
ncbi:MAG TPA: hypothetical protein HA364_05425 [Thermoplasmata archaeon]|nr:hypothetical protein [Thermoplasmata archaeon]